MSVAVTLNHQSEGAPVPITRHRGSNIGALGQVRLEDCTGGLLSCIGNGSLLGIDGTLDLAQTMGARLLPALVGAPAEIAGTGENAVRVKLGLLVEGNSVGGVRRAENMTAMTAVMAAEEEPERAR